MEKFNKTKVLEYSKRFSGIGPFSGLERNPEDVKPENAVIVFNNTAYLIFIRAKYLFVAILNSISSPVAERNEFAALVLLKAYWETVAAFGYAVLTMEPLLSTKDYEGIFNLAKRLGLGGKKFPSTQMLDKKGLAQEDFLIPNVLTMMDKIDKDWNKIFKRSGIKPLSSFSEEYDNFIAEAGHPTYSGLQIAGKWSKDRRTLVPDISKCWEYKDEKMLFNYLALGSTIFFYYWDNFQKLVKPDKK